MASEDQFHKLLADRKKQASQQQDIVDIKKFKSEVLSFIEENQSFEGILSETYDAEGRRKSHGQLECVDITSELVVPDCVSMLKSQARQANCSLDLLAAELLSKKMCQAIQACQNGRTQFLNDKQKAVMSTIILIIKTLLKENSFNRVHFAKCLSSHHQDNSNNVPLEVLWSLHTSHITSFNTYLACCSYNSASCRSLTQGLIDICNTSPHVTQDKQVVTLSVFLGILLPLAYKDKTNNDKRSNLEKVAEEILQNVIEGSMNSCTDESSKEQSRLDIFEVIRHVQHLPDQTIMRFFSDQLHKMLFKPSANSTVSYAVRNQNKWNFASLKEQTRTRFQQFLYMFKPSTIMEQLSQAFTRKEVDWQTLLSFLAVFLVCQEEAGALIKEYTDGLLQDVMATCDSHTMAVLLLVIRQASLEGAHVFPSYLTWFKSKFGNMATTPLSNRKTIQFFTQFLTDLVPCEPPYYLKVHIIKSPQVPSKLRDFVHDYDSLARTRLMDLKEPVELTGVYNLESSVLTQTEERTEQQKLQEQASKEVEKVLDSYGKTGKVPGSVMEASIFRKPYFIGRFLPALLTPRKLPESSDTRSKLINTLSKAGKISSTMLEAYFKACEKMAFDHDDSSEDDSALSDVDKLKKNLKSLTQDVICFIQKNDKITKTSISAKISLLAGHINSMVKTDQNVPCTSPVVIDVNSPCLDAKSIQVVDALLNSFCCMCTATRTIKCDHQMRFKWSADIVAMVMSISVINAALYYRLWDLLCSKGALSLTIQHIQGLAAFLCRLSSHQTPVLLMNTDNIMYKEQHGNSLSFIEVIFNLVPFSTHEWMEFSIRLCSAYLQHAAESSSVISILSATEKPQAVVKSTCFVPQSLIKKLWYLMHRFSFSAFCSQDCNSYEGIIDTINTVKATTLYQRLTDEAPKVSFDEWLMWELSIQRDEDIFSDTDRAQYHDATVLGYFTPLGVNDGGCGNSYRTACTMIIDRILDTNQMTQDRTDNNCQYNRQRNNTRKLCTVDLISLLERTLHLMVHQPQDNLSSGETRLPWLQQQYFTRIEKLKEIDIEYSTPASVLVEQETRTFTDLMLHLPSHLVFSDRPDKPLSKGDVSTAASFINSTLRLYTGVPCCLPLNITTYLLKGIISLSRVKDESLYFNESIIKQFCKECPLFFVSLQYYWEQVSVPISCMFCNNDTPSVLCGGQSLHQWIISFCCGSSVSKATPMAYPSWILAPCLYLGLQNSKNPVDCFQRLYTMIDTVFINKISVCLFACILSTFVEMVLHGHEISENKNTWDIAMELLKSYPNVLACFMVDSNGSEELHQLRTLILPNKHSKLLPVVYFSLLTECTPTVIEKVKQFPQFTQVSIKINQEFTELRKMCLEDKTYKSCEKPFQLEFARKVFQFLRHHAGS